jgi:hypothetical protein
LPDLVLSAFCTLHTWKVTEKAQFTPRIDANVKTPWRYRTPDRQF